MKKIKMEWTFYVEKAGDDEVVALIRAVRKATESQMENVKRADYGSIEYPKE